MTLTNPTFLVDGVSFTGKNISSPASVYQYTVGADGIFYISVALTVVGNGDYIAYLTHKWLTGGLTYTKLPKTTGTSAAGETNICFDGGPFIVKNTDVIDIMIDGLAGDTSGSGNVRIAQYNFSTLQASDNVGIDWGNISSSGSTVTLANTTIKTATNIETDTQDIQNRIPAALTANGNIKASLVEILTTALTETAGLLAGGFKKFFNVSSPTGTLNSIPDALPNATGGLAIVGSQMNLKDDAITSGKFDETTAYPQTEADQSGIVLP